MSKTKTVAIIGGGVSGLAAGGLLARKGYRVELFEANEKIGGCCSSSKVEGYILHDGALYLALPGVLDQVFDRLGVDRAAALPLRKITASHSTFLPDGTEVTIGENLRMTLDGGNGRTSGTVVQKELQAMAKRWEPVLRLFADDLMVRPLSLPRLLAQGWRHLPKFRGTVASELEKLFSDEASRAALSGVLLFTGVPPHKMPTFSMLGLMAMLTEGFYLPKGGMGEIPVALSRPVTNNGGIIHLNAAVERIVVKNGKACGVQVAGRGFVEADAVISTATGMATYSSLLNQEDVPESLRRKVAKTPLSHKSVVVQLGLANTIDAKSHNNSELPFMAEQDEVFRFDEFKMKWLTYSVPTVTMPELAPRGGSIVEMFPAIDQTLPVDRWDDEQKKKILDLAVAALSRRHRLDIAVKRVISPRDFRDSMHLYRGAVYGLSPVADPSAQFPQKSKIAGLYLAGQTTYPGYGIAPSAMSGVLVAENICKAIR